MVRRFKIGLEVKSGNQRSRHSSPYFPSQEETDQVKKYMNNQTVNDGVALSKNPRKCAYHVTFDLYLEHTVDAGLPGDHRVQVWWRSGHLSARRSDSRKSLQTDRQTDYGRSIALAHSWNELIKTVGLRSYDENAVC